MSDLMPREFIPGQNSFCTCILAYGWNCFEHIGLRLEYISGIWPEARVVFKTLVLKSEFF